jgi:hypothetical protein
MGEILPNIIEVRVHNALRCRWAQVRIELQHLSKKVATLLRHALKQESQVGWRSLFEFSKVLKRIGVVDKSRVEMVG